jgi:hypothetical protein
VACFLLYSLLGPGCAKESTRALKRSEVDPNYGIPPDVNALLDKAEIFELYSLGGEEGPESDQRFHGASVLGKMTVIDEKDRKKLVDAFRLGVEESTMSALCFFPRHGIRLKKGSETVDLVICFQCMQVHIIKDGQQKGVGISDGPRKTFNSVLEAAGIQLAKAPNG